MLSMDDGLNSYERSLVMKEGVRDEFFKEWIAEQRQLQLQPPEEAKYVIIYPMNSGLGNNLGILAEGILISMLTHRQLLSVPSAFSSPLVYRWPSFHLYFSLPYENFTLPISGFSVSLFERQTNPCKTR